MEIKHFVVLIISIFCILQSSSSTRHHRSVSNNNNSPAAPDAGPSTQAAPNARSLTLAAPKVGSLTPAAPDAGSSTPATPDEIRTTLEAPDEGEESPDADGASPESPYGSRDKSPVEPALGPSAEFSFANSKPASNPPGLDKICGATDLPVDCMKLISPFVNSSVKVEPLSIAKVGIRVSTEMSKQAIVTATRFMDDPKSSAKLKQAMSLCLELYEGIPDDNDLALRALDKRNAFEVKIKLSSSLTSVETCLDGIHQSRVTSPMRDMEAKLKKLLQITLTIVSGLVKF
ncbi:hypothetical protein F3Y22_tig00112616pilonHSYRG00020 [Hibiscus syriacus]|uniref:Pectinesterase inhibitor domain-containing protein n=1 Tax=Hibiscus syriacus TaxID=106335 RepID=A0A6A2Y4V0_HIBSY|nr:pectinesterase inhibitor 10-like [Hibiscus syriacus]KAE8665407.1 hypothetical protein F3Y22_tig00112616pilonHSYRG00020 [Hibiscus syriacus]